MGIDGMDRSAFQIFFFEKFPWFKKVLLAARPMAREVFAFIATRVLSNALYADTWLACSNLEATCGEGTRDAFHWLFLLAWSIEWRSRLGFDITFTWYDEENRELVLDPRLPALGIPAAPDHDG